MMSLLSPRMVSMIIVLLGVHPILGDRYRFQEQNCVA